MATFGSEPTSEEGVAVALRLLRARGRTRVELREQLLQRGFDERICEDVLTRLTQLGYLDDEKFAQARAQRLLQSGYGPLAIEQRMRQAGVDPSLALRSLRQAQEDAGVEEREQARALVSRRWRGAWPKQPKELARAARLLASRGYSGQIIESLLGDGTLEMEAPED